MVLARINAGRCPRTLSDEVGASGREYVRHSSRGDSLAARGGFSLVELLTVISIIGILAALVFPAVGRVLAAGRAAECASNLRTLGQAAQMYVAEHGGFLPGPGATVAYLKSKGVADNVASAVGLPDGAVPAFQTHWDALAPYVGVRLLGSAATLNPVTVKLSCPGAPFQGTLASGAYSLRALGYGANPCVIPRSSNVWIACGNLPLNDVSRPSAVILYADAGEASDGTSYYMINSAQYDEFTNPSIAKPSNSDEVIPSAALGESGSLAKGESFLGARHAGAANVLFVDGHIQRMEPGEIKQKNIFRSY